MVIPMDRIYFVAADINYENIRVAKNININMNQAKILVKY